MLLRVMAHCKYCPSSCLISRFYQPGPEGGGALEDFESPKKFYWWWLNIVEEDSQLGAEQEGEEARLAEEAMITSRSFVATRILCGDKNIVSTRNFMYKSSCLTLSIRSIPP